MNCRRDFATLAKVEQNMTPLIDVVFQLLAFFVMTFELNTLEGDFRLQLPPAGTASGTSSSTSLVLRMESDAAGRLTSMQLGDHRLGRDFAQLHRVVLELVGPTAQVSPTTVPCEVQLDCDPQLHYTHVIQAVTAVSGHLSRTGQVTRLIEHVRFAAPR